MKIEVSNGELVDKVSILSIKLKRIKDSQKLANVRKAYDLLRGEMQKIGISEASRLFQELTAVNAELWTIEDELRRKEAQHEFDDAFIQLARQVYFSNDRRARLKRDIDRSTGSLLMEEKEYSRYPPREKGPRKGGASGHRGADLDSGRGFGPDVPSCNS